MIISILKLLLLTENIGVNIVIDYLFINVFHNININNRVINNSNNIIIVEYIFYQKIIVKLSVYIMISVTSNLDIPIIKLR